MKVSYGRDAQKAAMRVEKFQRPCIKANILLFQMRKAVGKESRRSLALLSYCAWPRCPRVPRRQLARNTCTASHVVFGAYSGCFVGVSSNIRKAFGPPKDTKQEQVGNNKGQRRKKARSNQSSLPCCSLGFVIFCLTSVIIYMTLIAV